MRRLPRVPGGAYAALAAADTLLTLAPARWHRLRRVTKPLLMPALATRSTDPVVVAAQAFSWGGDVALLEESRGRFLAGVGSFLAAHLCYVKAYRARSSSGVLDNPERRRLLAGLAVANAGMGVAALRRDPVVAGPVAVYGLALASMVTAAAAIDPDRGRATVLAGALVFMASDTTLGARTFVLPEGAPPAVETVVMATYTAAQWLIAEGLARD